MSTDLRPPRASSPLPLPAPAPAPIPAPPAAEDPFSQNSWAQSLLMSAGMLGGLVFIMVNPSPLFLFGGAIFALAAVGSSLSMAVSQRRRGRRRLTSARDAYADRIGHVRDRFATLADSTYRTAWLVHPTPSTLATVPDGPRLFERRRHDSDFLEIRVGEGTVPSRHVPTLLTRGDVPLDTVSALLGRQLADEAATLPSMPVTVPLATHKMCMIDGDTAAATAMLRSLLMQAATWHTPADLRIAVAAPPERAADWSWVRWLPHSAVREGLLNDKDELSRFLTPELLAREADEERAATGTRSNSTFARVTRPHLLVVSDGLIPDAESAFGLLAQPEIVDITVIVLVREKTQSPRWQDLTVHVDANQNLTIDADEQAHRRHPTVAAGSDAIADSITAGQAEVAARRIARVAQDRAIIPTRGGARDASLPTLLSIEDLQTASIDQLWRPRTAKNLLSTVIGSTTDGAPVNLDVKESAAGGIGPHGLIVGATGSGKSELLRTIVTGLALTHPPEQLSFVLADFKGGAAFAGLAELPHVAGLITNLADDTVRVDRMRAALQGEILRRQEQLRRAGNLSTIVEYGLHAASNDEPMPYLLIIVDEFTELLTAQPDFAELFATVGRLGRSLGIHLLLASQRLDEGRLRGLESHISYRIALRTFSSIDSRVVLGVPDAFHLPSEPGWAFLKSGTMVFQRFRAAHASAPARRRPDDTPRHRSVVLHTKQRQREDTPGRYGTTTPKATTPKATTATAPAATADISSPVSTTTPSNDTTPPNPGGPTIWETAVRLLRDDNRRTHQVWLPPLSPAIALGNVLQVATSPERGMHFADLPGGDMIVPLGVVDLPKLQRYELMRCDLSGDKGNAVVLGAPQTGKTTLLRTLALSTALTHTPGQARFYCLDFSGGLRDLQALPHTAAVAARGDQELMTRIVDGLVNEISRRERTFADTGVTSMTQARASDNPVPDLLLLVDTLLDVRNDLPELEPQLQEIAHRGLSVGVHVIVTANRPADVRTGLRDALASRLELRLADPADSLVDRATARTLPPNISGRIVAAPGLIGQVALPAITPPDTTELTALRDTAELIQHHWTGPTAPPVRTLPARVHQTDLPTPAHDREPGVPIGIGEPDLEATYLDLTGHDPHLLVIGESQSGKTNTLRVLLHGLTARIRHNEAAFYVIDYRRSLLDTAEDQLLDGYAGAAPAANTIVQTLTHTLSSRLPGPDLTAAELRSRSWWAGPEIFVLVDDYELVDSTLGNPLAPLAEYLPQARDIGLHVILARGSSGVARALVNPLVQRIRDFGGSTLLLSADPAEGVVIGGIKPAKHPPGRGHLLHRRDPARRIQLALAPSHDGEPNTGTSTVQPDAQARQADEPTRRRT